MLCSDMNLTDDIFEMPVTVNPLLEQMFAINKEKTLDDNFSPGSVIVSFLYCTHHQHKETLAFVRILHVSNFN